MPALSIDERIAQAQQRIEQLRARKEAIETKKLAKLVKNRKAADTRRKILVGALVMKFDNSDPLKIELMMRLDKFLKSDDDRDLFDLPPLPKGQ